jgi:hypothetical protein
MVDRQTDRQTDNHLRVVFKTLSCAQSPMSSMVMVLESNSHGVEEMVDRRKTDGRQTDSP